ncbi:MAG: flagellar filament capping protein FliD [Anaerovibrio sp.]|nr:flagellar filament capping protein FliD [Anaerovibrio sp.]
MGVNGIYGLSGSGLDIESLVKMGMMNKQNQYDKMYQTDVRQTWVKEAYNNIYTTINTFKSNMSDFKMQSNMNAMSATSTNKDVVSVTANGAAAAMNHKISVSSIASNAYLMTGDGKTIDRAQGAVSSTSTALSDVIYGSRLTNTTQDADGHYQYTIDGNTVNGSDVAISLEVQDSDVLDGQGNPTTHKIELTYDNIFQDKKTLSDFASAFSASGANVQGGYDTTNDSFSLYNKTSGSSNLINLTSNNDDTTTLLNNLHLASYNASSESLTDLPSFTTGTTAEAAKGTNAEATIDGKKYTSATNKLTVAGVIYNLNSVSAKNADGTYQSSTVTVSQDTDTVVDNVKKFVDMYNTLLDSLNDKLSEKQYSDYKPLTKSQEAAMTKEQVTQWNEKAKSGLLYHDSNISSLVSAMRESIYTKVDSVDSKYNSLSSIGITTTTNNIKGHLSLDETKLKKALAEDPDCVYQLFASDQDSTYVAGSTDKNQSNNTAYNKKNDYLNTGVANRLYNVMTENMTVIEKYAGTSTATNDESYLGKLITNNKTRMTSFQTLMKAYESNLYKKYDAMEVALSKLGAQLSYITG